MKTLRNIRFAASLILAFNITSCSSSRNNSDVAGKYTSESENEFDYFKDTMEIRSTDDGKFDVQIIANWSAAKKDDPQRPNKNKKAGVWNNYGKGEIRIATLQASDMTLRITDPMAGSVRIMTIDPDKNTIEITSRDGTKRVYQKIP